MSRSASAFRLLLGSICELEAIQTPRLQNSLAHATLYLSFHLMCFIWSIFFTSMLSIIICHLCLKSNTCSMADGHARDSLDQLHRRSTTGPTISSDDREAVDNQSNANRSPKPALTEKTVQNVHLSISPTERCRPVSDDHLKSAMEELSEIDREDDPGECGEPDFGQNLITC